MEVLELKPFGLEGSGGSTPLRLTVAGDPDQYVFAKLYRTGPPSLGSLVQGRPDDPLRLSRGRGQLLVGATPRRVRGLHPVRMQDADLPIAAPFGIVEITPEREYLMVSEYLLRSQEFTDATIDDSIVHQSLLMIRKLWDAGLAHRDIKPANVMVHNGRVNSLTWPLPPFVPVHGARPSTLPT